MSIETSNPRIPILSHSDPRIRKDYYYKMYEYGVASYSPTLIVENAGAKYVECKADSETRLYTLFGWAAIRAGDQREWDILHPRVRDDYVIEAGSIYDLQIGDNGWGYAQAIQK